MTDEQIALFRRLVLLTAAWEAALAQCEADRDETDNTP